MSKAPVLGLSDKLVSLIAATEDKTGLPKGALLSVLGQEVGSQASKFIKDPAAYHYEKNAAGKRIAKHTGKVSTAFGPFGILESTGAKPGYGVAPLKDKSLEEQVRFAGEYLAARAKQAGSFEKGLAGYGEGAKYAQQVSNRMEGKGGRPSPQQLQEMQVPPPSEQQPRVVAQAASPAAMPMQTIEPQVQRAPTMSYQDQVAQEMEAFLNMDKPKSAVEALLMAQAQQEAEAQQARTQIPAQEDSFMSAFNYSIPQKEIAPYEAFSPYSAFTAWGRG